MEGGFFMRALNRFVESSRLGRLAVLQACISHFSSDGEPGPLRIIFVPPDHDHLARDVLLCRPQRLRLELNLPTEELVIFLSRPSSRGDKYIGQHAVGMALPPNPFLFP